MIWYYVVSWWNTSNPVRWISNAVWLQAAILQNCGLHMAIHIWLQSFRIRHPFWRPQNRGRHWSHACSWATKYLWTKKERWFETAIVCKADAALVDHVRPVLASFPPPFPSPPMHVFPCPQCTSLDGPGGNRTPPSPNCHLVHQPQNRPRWPPYSVGEVPQNGPFWSDRPPDPLFSLRSQRATSAKLDSWLS